MDIIIEDLNWQRVTHETEITQSVCQLRNEFHQRCSCVKVGNVVLTAAHCVPTEKKVKVIFTEKWHRCKKRYYDPYYDIAALDCGELEYPSARVAVEYFPGAIEVVHWNCDWREDVFCDVVKLSSPGEIMKGHKTFYHTADTLAGSSGAPVFQDGRLVGIHTSGLEGEYNMGTWIGVIDE